MKVIVFLNYFILSIGVFNLFGCIVCTTLLYIDVLPKKILFSVEIREKGDILKVIL